MSRETVFFDDVECFKETAAAVLVGPAGDEGSAVWIPKSVIESGDIGTEGDAGCIEVQEWFVEKEGIDL